MAENITDVDDIIPSGRPCADVPVPWCKKPSAGPISTGRWTRFEANMGIEASVGPLC